MSANRLLKLERLEFIFCVIMSCFVNTWATIVTQNNALNYFSDSKSNKLWNTKFNITQISTDAFKNLKNECLSFHLINCKGLVTLPKNLFHEGTIFKHVREIKLSGNSLSAIYKNLFSGLFDLEKLDLQDNKLRRLHPLLLISNINLREIYLDKNDIRTLPDDIFKYNQKICNISLSQNQLKSLPSPMLNFVNTKMILNLTGNNLTYIDNTIFADNVQSLVDSIVDIRHNYLVCLPNSYLEIPQSHLLLTENCFNESSNICQTFACNNRYDRECIDARHSTNVTNCQNYWRKKLNNLDENGEVKSGELDTKDKPNVTGLIIICILLPSLVISLLGGIGYVAYKDNWISQIQEKFRKRNHEDDEDLASIYNDF